jgi:hypothetical protein
MIRYRRLKMTRKKGLEERLEDVEDSIKSQKMWRTICITATTATLSVLYTVGQWAYARWDALEAGVKAFFAATRQ